jgi:hypothetical protein
MRYPFFIGLRYLRAKRSEGFLSLITAISTGGVAVGVMTLNVVLAVMTGFEEDLRDRILGFTPHVVVSDYGASMSIDPAVETRLRAVPGVAAADAFVQGQAMLASGIDVAGVLLRGVHPEPGGAIDFSRHLRGGQINDLATRHTVRRDDSGATVELPGIILGTELARQLDVTVGQPISVVARRRRRWSAWCQGAPLRRRRPVRGRHARIRQRARVRVAARRAASSAGNAVSGTSSAPPISMPPDGVKAHRRPGLSVQAVLARPESQPLRRHPGESSTSWSSRSSCWSPPSTSSRRW